MKGGWVYNSQLFLNELYRIGGIKTLKGFDEQSIFASTFALLNIEMKYLFQQNSGFLLFANAAYYENRVMSKPTSDWPWGIGAGLNLETGAGLFSLYYALGSQKGNPLEWRDAKIHFGLLNFF
jgi:hemolysin activation/secretion protein